MQEKWREVESFPGYRVSNLGRVKSIKTDFILSPATNQEGHLKVNLREAGKSHTRQVNQIVAKAYLEPPKREDFNSVIHLDGDKTNCAPKNLMWRPRYFAIRYHQQFGMESFTSSRVSVVDIKTGEVFKTAQEAAVRHGLIFTEILLSAQKLTFVWPTYQQYRIMSEIG